ncbi:MAG: DNA gyrase subunit A [Pseudomonadota bacterium]|nr:DNA gyrase subunit A [Pseudomonadota bacterium]
MLIQEEMKTAYLDYAMSVIVSRAIPDLRDGLKPVHRRILYAMHESGNTKDKPYRKSARPVGDVMGKYHPHGDSAIYDSLVRMAQSFSMSLPLLDGQGNFGSMDGDSPAAMRYTEVRMETVANFILADIEKDTVDFQDNYDGKDKEPVVLPARFPNMLVNGAGGIAVGMATNIPPHNLGEVIDGAISLIENPEISIAELTNIIPAPDFPTGALILGTSGARKAYNEGRGSVIIRSKTKIEEIRKDRFAIIVEEIPYQVNKSTMIERIAEMAKEKRIEGISHVQDESDRQGVRVVIELKKDSTPEVVLNQLYKFTPLQTSFGCNMLALNAGRPVQLSLKEFLESFLTFREEVIARRTAYELRKARERSHLLCGLAVAVSNTDEIVNTIRSSSDPAEAREKLTSRRWSAKDIREYILLIDDPTNKISDDGSYFLSEPQAKAILELRLQRLTALGVKEVTTELKELAERIKEYLSILGSRTKIREIIRDELTEVKNKYAIPRRSEIVKFDGEMEDEDLIEQEEMVVTVTQSGYIKRTALSEYREQKRGGKGSQGMNTKDEDVVTSLFVANTHTPLLFFTSGGIVYKIKTWRLPQGGRNSRGKAIVNLLPVETGSTIAAIMPVDAPEEEWKNLQIVFATSTGDVRRNALSDFTNVKSNGKIAMKLPIQTSLVGARICSERNDVMLTTSKGKCIRFPVTDVRIFKGRDSIGVRGIKLLNSDHVVSMAIITHVDASSEERNIYFKMRRAQLEDGQQPESSMLESFGTISEDRYEELLAKEEWILTLTSSGFGKRSSAHEFRVSSRGGQGISVANLERRDDTIVASFPVEDDDQIMLVTSTGQSIRCPVQGISRQSRTASGVKVFNTANNEKVVSVAWIAEQNETELDIGN